MITVQQKSESQLQSTANPEGVTYRLFDCPSCGFTIAFRLKTVHKCRSCEATVPDILRLMDQTRYRLCYHHGIVDEKGYWDWNKHEKSFY